MRSQILRHLRENPIHDGLLERLTQIAQRRWRSYENELLTRIVVRETAQDIRDLDGEALLAQPMPIGLFHRTSLNGDARGDSAGLIRSLLASRRILVLEHPLYVQIDIVRGACVAEEERFGAIPDHNQRSPRNM